MITLEDYFGKRLTNPEVTAEMIDNAAALLFAVNRLLGEAVDSGDCKYEGRMDPDTGTCISGSKGGSGDGGFRLSGSTTGKIGSLHRIARAVDVYDPGDYLDSFISRFDLDFARGNTFLEKFDLYREAPSASPGWLHLQNVPPGSLRRTFFP